MKVTALPGNSLNHSPIYLESWGGGDVVLYDGPEKIGFVRTDIINGNVIITVERLDEERFGPVSLVVT